MRLGREREAKASLEERMEIASAAARRRLKRAEDRVAGRDGATSAIANDDLATLRAMFPSVYPGVVAMIYADVAGQQIERAIESLLAITDDSHAGGGADGDGDIDADATPDTTVPADAVDTAALQHDLAELRAVKEKLESDADDGTLREQVALATQELALARQMLVAAEERAEAYAKKYVTEFFLRKELHNQLQDLVGNLRVFCRIRPPRSDELLATGVGGAEGGQAAGTHASEAAHAFAVEARDETTAIVLDRDDERRPIRRRARTCAKHLPQPHAGRRARDGACPLTPTRKRAQV